jgi:hypothetical protein
MATNFNGLRKTREILDAIAKKIEALNLPDSDEKAFQTVKIASVADVEAAIEQLLVIRDRVALIVFDGDHFENEVRGTDLDSSQSRNIDVLVTDRVIDRDYTKALLGTKDHPGTLTLKDLVIEEVSGLLLPNPHGVYLEAIDTQTAVMKSAKQKDQPGRCWMLINFTAKGGLLTKDLGKGPIQ